MKRLIIHIGLPKTATTSLQENLFGPLDGDAINYIGKRSFTSTVNPYKIPNFLKGILYNEEYDEIAEKRGYWVKSLDKDIVVLSNEDFSLAVTQYLKDSSVKYLNPYSTAVNLKKYFSVLFDQIEIIIVLRNQSELIYSFYVEIFKWKYRFIPELDSFDKFLKSGLTEKMSGNFMMFYYDQLLDTYADLFGKENLHIMLYEDLKYDYRTFCNSVANILEIPPIMAEEYLKGNELNKKTTTYNNNYITDNIDFSYSLNKSISKILRSKPFYNLFNSSNWLKRTLKKVYLKTIWLISKKIIIQKGVEITRPNQVQSQEIWDEFRESNYRAAKKYDLDIEQMSKYGYF